MGLSSGHIWLVLIVLVVVLIIWGPGKLPDVGSGLGRAIKEFRKASQDTKDSFNNTYSGDATPTSSATPPPPSAPPVAAQPGPPVGTQPTEEQKVPN